MTVQRPRRLPIYLEPDQVVTLVEVIGAIVDAQDDLQLWEFLEGMNVRQLEKLSVVVQKLRFLKRVTELPPKGGKK